MTMPTFSARKVLTSVAFLFPLILVVVACAGGSEDLDRNPREGQFYSNEEIMNLSKGARDAYCNELNAYLADLRKETADFTARLDTLATMGDTLRTQTIELSSEIREVNSELRELRLRRKSLTEYKVKEGDTLRQIAKLLYGDALKWKDIYEANKAKIGAEDAPLKAGAALKIPR